MIKKIFHLGDLHIPNTWDNKRPYDEMLEKALLRLEEECQKYDKDEFRIVISGDIFCSKVKISTEANALFANVLTFLNNIGNTVIIAGNHDMLVNNKSRLDAITPHFINEAYPNITYLDKVLDYQSGCVVDENIVWCLYSMFDDFKRPEDIDNIREQYPDAKLVALYHGDIVGAKTDVGRMCEDGLPFDSFSNCNCAMLGHIHKYQEVKKNGIPFVYSGSMLQQNFGENTTGHGFVVWDMESNPTPTHKLIEVTNDYRMFKLVVSSYEDIDNDIEKLMNL